MAITPFTLPETERNRLQGLDPDIIAIQKEVNKAKRAGIDVTGIQARLDKIKNLRDGILREYGKVTK